MLPVFLDHILHPRIVPETVDMEVFSLKVEENDDQVSGQGVVYCEMKGRQNSEADLLDFNLRHELCSFYETENPVLSRFKWECGGLTKDIATLSTEEIIAFHRCFYNPANISIIICGKLNDEMENQLLSCIDSVLKSSEKYEATQVYRPQEIIQNDSPFSKSRVVQFPSNEDDLGSVGLAWPGSLAKDLTKVLSFHVIFKYLRETSSSPLYQQFVQIETPWATDIDYEIKSLYQTIMVLVFSGVPHRPDSEAENGLVPGRIRSLLKEVLSSLVQNVAQLEQMIRYCLCSFELKLIELIEDDPYETIVSYTVPELITSAIENNSSSEIYGKHIFGLKKIIASLKEMPVEYWMSLLNELIEVEPVEVIMIPDTKLNDKIEKGEKEFLLELLASGKARVCQMPEITPYNIEGNFELMTDSQMTPFKKIISPEGVHMIELPGTGLKQLVRTVNFKQSIPEELWPYLVLYQELLFQCDVNLSSCPEIKNILGVSDDKLPYQLLQKILNSKLNSYGVNFGLENDTFSLGYCEEALNWTVILPSSSDISLKICLSILETIATSSIFTVDRIKIVSENLYNQIQDLLKDPYEIIESILTLSLHDLSKKALSESEDQKKIKLNYSEKVFETSISMFNQKGLLKGISHGDSVHLEAILEKLRAIQMHMKKTIELPSFVQISSLAHETFDFETKDGRDNFDISQLPKFGRLALEAPCSIAYAIGDITANYMSVVVPCEILPSDRIDGDKIREYVSVSLICQLLSVTEGPIYSSIRGRGLAYDASLTVSLWNGLLTFAVNDSNDPFNAFKEFRTLMNSINDEFISENWVIINDGSLNVAKSAFLYQMIEESSTPSSMFNSCFKNYLRSIPMASNSSEIDPVMEVIRSVTRSDLTKAWFKHFPRLLSGNVLSVLVTPKSISATVISQFEGLIDFQLRTFNNFSSEIEIEAEEESESEGSDSDDDESGSSNSENSETEEEEEESDSSDSE